uniref:Uncharacterized protein n=1 Tax=viral metagenome TaxID=1070528 RepID=A0A6C0AMW8_9ZZZZ
MSNLESILNSLKQGFASLRRDGLFINASILSEDTLLLETTTYITDTDDGKDVDCLCVYEDELGLGGSCVCEDITTGEWLKEGAEAQRGCVACPVCQRLAKPMKLQKRCYNLTLKVHETSVSHLSPQPNKNLKAMPMGMTEKIIDLTNAMFPVSS